MPLAALGAMPPTTPSLHRTAHTQAYGMPRTAATVAHGGSYAGSLAAWARVLHPRTFHASLASSSVVRMMMGSRSYQEIKFDTSNEMSAHVRQLGGAECGVLQGPLQWSHEGRLTLAAAARWVAAAAACRRRCAVCKGALQA